MKILDIISLARSGRPVTRDNLKMGLLVKIIRYSGKGGDDYSGDVNSIGRITFIAVPFNNDYDAVFVVACKHSVWIKDLVTA